MEKGKSLLLPGTEFRSTRPQGGALRFFGGSFNFLGQTA
jgi:hypothetical protein